FPFFFQAEDGIRDFHVTGVQTCALPIYRTGQPILDFNEDPGDGGNDSTSLYIVAFGEDENVYGLSGLGGSMEVRDFGETEAAPGHLGRVEWYPGVAIDNPYSVVRLKGLAKADPSS